MRDLCGAPCWVMQKGHIIGLIKIIHQSLPTLSHCNIAVNTYSVITCIICIMHTPPMLPMLSMLPTVTHSGEDRAD